MRFETRHRIPATVDEVERALFDDRYPAFLLQNHGVLLEVQPLEKRDEGGQIHRKIRYRPKPVIASIGPKPVPPEWFAFVESSTWDKARKELTFTNTATTNGISKMLISTGTLKLVAAGQETDRIMEGEVGLKLPFIMKPLALIGERVISSEGIKLLDAEVPVVTRFIREVLRA